MEEHYFKYGGMCACAVLDIAIPKGKIKTGRVVEVGVHTSGRPNKRFDDLASLLSGLQNAGEIAATIEVSLDAARNVAESASRKSNYSNEVAVYFLI